MSNERIAELERQLAEERGAFMRVAEELGGVQASAGLYLEVRRIMDDNKQQREALEKIVAHPETYNDGSVIHAGGWIFSTLKGIARAGLRSCSMPE